MDSPARPSQAKMASSTGGTEGSSPASSPASAASLAAMAAPKFGTLVPNRIFVGGISANTSEAELAQLFSAYGNVKATKIIADRGGVSKGYGFVTFETEEEAKRLQNESECIILKERKLNIAPAIKKQPFNRSFDGGTGSPPAVPTSTYYYTNGMGLPYQNGVTFYNTGAPAPGATIAPATETAALYQAAGVFGPQATASHQTFAPMMYPVPAPSLYMPQQYQYSPMPYEPYFPGTAAAGAPQFLYTANNAPASTSGNGNGTGNNNSGSSATAPGATATSPPSAGAPSLGPSPPQFQAHFYGPAASTSHHHPGVLGGGPHPPPPQIEHLYYSYPPPATQGPPHHGGQLTLASDQQLLIYTTEIGGQPNNESQINQEDNRSTSSHAEQQQQQSGSGTVTSDPGGGSGGGSNAQSPATQPPSESAAVNPAQPAVYPPLMPLKHPWSNRQPNFQAVSLQTSPVSSQSQQTSSSENNNNDDTSANVPHYSIYPTPLYIPHRAAPFHTGNSLLPTPPQQPYDLGKYPKTGFAGSGSFGKSGPPPPGASALVHPHHQSAYVKQFNGPPLQAPAVHQKYPRVSTPPTRLTHQYGKRGAISTSPQQQQPCYFSPKSYGAAGSPRPGQQFIYGAAGQPYAVQAAPHHGRTGGGYTVTGIYEYTNGRRSVSSEHSDSGHPRAGRKNLNVNSYRGPNLTMSANVSNNNSCSVVESNHANNNGGKQSESVAKAAEGGEVTPAKAGSPPPTSSQSPLTRPHHSPSPNTPNQVQFFGGPAGGQQQQQRFVGSQRGNSGRHPGTSSTAGRGGGKALLRQGSGGKYRVNGVVQTGKLGVNEASLGGAGDAPPVGGLPLTPPGTPQQQSSEQNQQQINESCHQMQALSL